MRVKEKVTNSFVEDWKSAWKWLSIQFAVLVGGLLAYASANPEQILKIVDMLPDGWRPVITFIVVTGIPIYLRLKKQGSSQ